MKKDRTEKKAGAPKKFVPKTRTKNKRLSKSDFEFKEELEEYGFRLKCKKRLMIDHERMHHFVNKFTWPTTKSGHSLIYMCQHLVYTWEELQKAIIARDDETVGDFLIDFCFMQAAFVKQIFPFIDQLDREIDDIFKLSPTQARD